MSAAVGDPAAARVRRPGGVVSSERLDAETGIPARRGRERPAWQGLGLAGYIGYSWPHPASTDEAPPAPGHPASSAASGKVAADPAADVDHFVTRSDIHPPAITVTRAATGASQPPYIFIAPRGYTSKSTGQSRLMIVDRDGRLVWSGQPLGGTPLNFTTQEYRGKPVLTWWAWQKTGVAIYGRGNCYIADSSYAQIAEVKCGNGPDGRHARVQPHQSGHGAG